MNKRKVLKRNGKISSRTKIFIIAELFLKTFLKKKIILIFKQKNICFVI